MPHLVCPLSGCQCPSVPLSVWLPVPSICTVDSAQVCPLCVLSVWLFLPSVPSHPSPRLVASALCISVCTADNAPVCRCLTGCLYPLYTLHNHSAPLCLFPRLSGSVSSIYAPLCGGPVGACLTQVLRGCWHHKLVLALHEWGALVNANGFPKQ